MKKRALALCMSLVLCISLLPSALAADAVFSDVPAGSWFEQGVTTCAEKGVMVGTGAGLFSPDAQLTAAECLTLAVRLYDLRHGGDGVLNKAPEEWGKMVLTLEDGTVFQGYGENSTFIWWEWKNGNWGVQVIPPGETEAEREAWGKAHEGPATMTVDGVEYQGSVSCWLPVSQFMLVFSTGDETTREVLRSAVYSNIPAPEQWYRNTVYTAHQLGLNNETLFPGFSALLRWNLTGGSGAFRGKFSLALAEAAGELPRLYTVETLPDLERTGNEAVWGLYEAGVLTGIDEYGCFGADSSLTRAQAAVMVSRVLDESQRVATPPREGGAYAQSVAELRTGFTYYGASERTYETEDCTVFVYDRGGAMHTGNGNITIIYKPGSQPGAGAVVAEETPFSLATYQNGPDRVDFNAKANTLTYAYRIEEDLTGWGEDAPNVKAGIYTYTVDLPTAQTTQSYAPFSLEASAEVLAKGRNYTLERRLDGENCAAILRWHDLTWTDDTRDYELWLVRGDGAIQKLLLPSTVLRSYGSGYYKPTHRPPDSMDLSEDGKTLTYIYRFDEALASGDDVLHEAGTYTYTVDLTTGELSVTHTTD